MIVVTGGNGFLGRLLIEKTAAISASRHGKIKIDITKPVTLKKLKNYSTIIHCAAKVGYTWLPWFQVYRSFYKVNVKGTENLLKTTKPRYFVFISTLAIYSSQDLKKIKPRSFYGLTKYLAELKCKEYARKKKFKLLIVRLPMVYDIKEPRREAWLFKKFGFVLRLFRPLLRKKKIRIISRKEAVELISSLIKKRKEGTVNVKGRLIDLCSFIELLKQDS